MAGKIALAVLVAGVLATAGFAIFGGGNKASGPQYKTVASVKPATFYGGPRLTAIYAQASELLPGGVDAFNARIKSLRGLPIVVNKWGSWCNPCRREFPSFQGAAKKWGGSVAFLGANVQDSVPSAKNFLAQYPVPYPSYIDDKLQISKMLRPAGFAPVTGFYDRTGRLVYVHPGPYDTAAALERDMQRYLDLSPMA